jgi:hypothetical protein
MLCENHDFYKNFSLPLPQGFSDFFFQVWVFFLIFLNIYLFNFFGVLGIGKYLGNHKFTLNLRDPTKEKDPKTRNLPLL